MPHPAIRPDHLAVVTGAASGIGLAAARRLLAEGLRVVLIDRDGEGLAAARAALRPEDGTRLVTLALDVADRAAVEEAARAIVAEHGPVHVLLNNAGIQPGSSIFGPSDAWDAVLGVNLGGVLNVARAFGAAMVESGAPGLIVNTGSKQGITTPPGDPAYNVAKAGVKVFTEALQHELRNREGGLVEARLFIPGFVFTGLTKRGRTEKPDGAWTPDQVVDFLFESLERPDFYILCPDGEVTRAMDEKRVAWAAGDIVENRPPLSRWHPDHAEAFKAFAAK
ncbi:SDR family oxidoreductase [Aurantimonas sp. Leaf443]|uniref:SDR family NAD(P)-dependent oxidoreductase n=1 Tax=Aurantimonas sp. Leaf443 TaxID=1736378 RepID=UPI0006FCD54A|nr:SDR family oxidoreductase [Aurantimonas sp. Leaf443]KQT83091.1 short-chain dehydrogenase [Aurantimonas sp. Leaf443]